MDDHIGGVESAVFSPDGHFIATAGADRSVKIWGAETGELVHSLNGDDGYGMSVSFSPDGSHLLVAGWDDNVTRVWSLDSSVQGMLANAERRLFYSLTQEAFEVVFEDATACTSMKP
jgi:WD40 repeat protein